MGMNMAGEQCLNCGEDLEEGQSGLCFDCWRGSASVLTDCGATHGSPELDADARKLEAMGQDAGPTLTDLALAAFIPPEDELTPRVQKAILAFDHAMSIMVHLLAEHQRAWEGEEDSVKEEHAELIAKTEKLLALSKHWLGGDEA